MKSDLVDLKQSKKAQEAKPVAQAGEDYPYGLTIHLDHDTLQKLGVKDLPKTGSHVHLHAHAHVQSTEVSDRNGKKRRHMDLQLRKMAIEASKPEHANDREGMLRGAKAAMDKALDRQE